MLGADVTKPAVGSWFSRNTQTFDGVLSPFMIAISESLFKGIPYPLWIKMFWIGFSIDRLQGIFHRRKVKLLIITMS
jgi:hypothetical protein